MTKVLYVAGWQRSGTTILGNTIGSVPNVAHVGELNFLWAPDNPGGDECGCGKPIPTCKLWSSVLKDVNALSDEDRLQIHRLRQAQVRMRYLPRIYAENRRDGRVPGYAERLGQTYQAIAHQANASVVVDTTKFPSDGLAAVLAPDIQVFVLHLVRDPRASAYSWTRKKRHGANGSGQLMRAKAPFLNSARWLQVNSLTDIFLRRTVPAHRFMRLRYEDLMSNPRQIFNNIAEWVGIDKDALPFEADHDVRIKPSHTVMGNPNRFDRGITALKLDSEWIGAMSESDRWSATFPALPLMRTYGYSVLRRGLR